MTQQTVRITEITPPPPNTRQPWRFKDGNGTTYKTFNPQLAQLVEKQQGQPLAVQYDTQVNGKYTDNILKSASVPDPTPEAKPNGGTGWRPDPARDMKESERNRYIVRESCLKSAVDLAVGMLGRAHDELTDDQEAQMVKGTLLLADKFVEWVYESGAKNSGKGITPEMVQEVFPGAQKIGPKVKTP